MPGTRYRRRYGSPARAPATARLSGLQGLAILRKARAIDNNMALQGSCWPLTAPGRLSRGGFSFSLPVERRRGTGRGLHCRLVPSAAQVSAAHPGHDPFHLFLRLSPTISILWPMLSGAPATRSSGQHLLRATSPHRSVLRGGREPHRPKGEENPGIGWSQSATAWALTAIIACNVRSQLHVVVGPPLPFSFLRGSPSSRVARGQVCYGSRS